MEATRLNQVVIPLDERVGAGLLPPEVVAEVIETEIGERYFDVLRCLSSEAANPAHLALARLAKAGALAAIITTNFDRAIESALEQLDVPFRVAASPDEFNDLGGNFGVDGQCAVVKLHGDLDRTYTLVDTLQQRLKGPSLGLLGLIAKLLEDHHWLFMGYSGADLNADPNYLTLWSNRENANGLTWLTRPGAKPLPAASWLVSSYGEKAQFLEFDIEGLSTIVDEALPGSAQAQVSTNTGTPTDAYDEARKWAAALGVVCSAVLLEKLLSHIGQPCFELVSAVYQGYSDQRGAGANEDWARLCNSMSNATVELERAAQLQREALDIYGALGNQLEVAKRLTNIGIIEKAAGKPVEAIRATNESIALFRQLRDRRCEARALTHLASVHSYQGEYREAESCYLESLRIQDELGDVRGGAETLFNLGYLYVQAGEPETGAEHFQRALQMNRSVGAVVRVADCFVAWGEAASAESKVDNAIKFFERAMQEYRALGMPEQAAYVLSRMALCYAANNRTGDAIQCYEACLRSLPPGLEATKAGVLNDYGLALAMAERDQDSLIAYVESEQLATRFEDWDLLGRTLNNQAFVFERLGEIDEMFFCFHRALDLCHNVGDQRRLSGDLLK
ncbi:MAG: tetratricopeptide repeat protein [Planctomycetota bacterium]